MTPVKWARIKEIFSAAREQPEPERAAWLHEACGREDALRAEVERLLAQDDESLPGPAAALLAEAAPALAVGEMLSHYRVEAKIGQGGMGAVYRAYDTRLHRQVALKVLPPGHLADPEGKHRLMREARAASALNHPNIIGIYEVASDKGVDFIAMEFVGGRSLNEVIPAKGLPLGKALDYASQIAGGLARAHAAAVVHRDLKPGNIMVTRDGLIKLLDFGLARRVRLRCSETSTQTMECDVAGTPGYMSPEQVRGEAVDHRSDIFSFGCVLYEMLLGHQAFRGASTVESMNSILHEEPPDLATLDSTFSPGLERIVRHCLEKNPETRFQSAGDLAFDLEALSLVSARTVATVHPIRKWTAAAMVSSLLAAVAVVAGVTVMLMSRSKPTFRPSLRLTVTLPGDAPLAPVGLVSPAHDRPAFALSPDGTRLAYVAQVAGKTQLCVRDMTNGRVTPLAATEGGNTPFFSPDGASLAFFANGKLKKTSSNGGGVVVLADAPNPWGGVWGTDNAIYFNRYEGEGIFRVAADGGPVQVVATGQHFMPELLGGGQRLLATSGAGTVYLDERQTSRVVMAGFGARYVPPDHLVYAVRGKLLAVPFDRSRIEVTGPAVSLFEDLRTANYGVAQFTLAQDGTLIYASGRPQEMTSFVWVDRKGKAQPLGLPERLYSAFALSRDGRRLALTERNEVPGGDTDIWIYDLPKGPMSRLTPRAPSGRPAANEYPRWTPDGKHVVYVRLQGSQGQLVWAAADGSAESVVLWSSKPTGPAWLYPMSFSADGSVLAVFGPSPNSSYDIWLMRLAGIARNVPTEPELFLGDSFAECFGQVSPDGHWMLYASDRSGRYEIYVTTYPKPGAIHQISANGGREPLWNPSAAEILYVEGMRMYAVDVTLGPVFRAGEPRLLFEGPYPDVPGLGYDIAPDGRRFLMLANEDILKPSATLTVVTNFFDELRRRVPSGSARK